MRRARYALKTIKKAKVKRVDYLRREIDLLLTVNFRRAYPSYSREFAILIPVP